MKLLHFEAGIDRPLFLIAGPCVVESETLQVEVAGRLKEITARLGVPFVFKSSYDKANRSSRSSYRGPGIEAGLRVLAEVRRQVGVPVITDVHEDTPFGEVAAVVDKARSTGNEHILVCERGFSFGYNNLVSDMRALSVMRATGCPVVFDATHSVQLPGGKGTASGGQREFVPVLARAAVAAGIAGLFMETHPEPDEALSDGPNAWPLPRMAALLETLVELDRAVKRRPFDEDALAG
ncbi:MAG: 3-deoxy-8-phosphooctulonate synthase [Pseudomonadota bacterium]